MISLRGESIEFHFCTQALLMALFTLVHHQRKGSCDLDVCGLHGDHVMGSCDVPVNTWQDLFSHVLLYRSLP